MYKVRTQSEQVEETEIAGYSVIKIAKYVNLIVGTSLVVVVIASLLTFGFINIFNFTMTCFEGIFGMLIVFSSFNLKLIKDNFLFLMTGAGKASFNIFVGTLLFILTPNPSIMQMVMGITLIGSGCIFAFLSCCKHVSDEDLQRAVSVNQKQAYMSV